MNKLEKNVNKNFFFFVQTVLIKTERENHTQMHGIEMRISAIVQLMFSLLFFF